MSREWVKKAKNVYRVVDKYLSPRFSDQMMSIEGYVRVVQSGPVRVLRQADFGPLRRPVLSEESTIVVKEHRDHKMKQKGTCPRQVCSVE